MGVPSRAVVARRIEGPACESFPESCAGDILLVFKKDVPFYIYIYIYIYLKAASMHH